ncbi:DUF1761 domain-containing protein [Oceaniglobus trochenteri]|uniref:DUF1761 domain-containing protein n=1 Tax=Oceaniglobus trochenteri TaxID=2763260 RepID=UPI001D000DFC|nr:DUF1761 domain-containing protein [Oceaniglobus trochenteri]
MGIVSVIAAAVVAWLFGAVWYGLIAKPWIAASGLDEENLNRKDPVPYIGSFIATLLVAGILRQLLGMSGVMTVSGGIVTGFFLGLFMVTPWIATNILFQGRPKSLIWMDGAYPTVGMALMGLVLTLF